MSDDYIHGVRGDLVREQRYLDALTPEPPRETEGLRSAREKVRLRLHDVLSEDASKRDHARDLNAECNSLARWIVDDVRYTLAAARSVTPLEGLRAEIEYRLTVGLRHVPGLTEREERAYNDGQAFGLRYALERIDAASTPASPETTE